MPDTLQLMMIIMVWYSESYYVILVTTGAEGGVRFQTGHEFQPIDFSLFACTGRENSLLECSGRIRDYCQGGLDASVTCSKC